MAGQKGITLKSFHGGEDIETGRIILDEPCDSCGVGLPSCSECEGIGSVPTENGLQLLQFLRRYNAQFKAEEI